jgi:hypothetical protein
MANLFGMRDAPVQLTRRLVVGLALAPPSPISGRKTQNFLSARKSLPAGRSKCAATWRRP